MFSKKYWRLWVFASMVTLGSLFGYLELQGIHTGHNGDMVCGGSKVCEGYFFIDVPAKVTNYLGQSTNITQLCFGKDMKVQLTQPEDVQNLGLYIADRRYGVNNPARWKLFSFAGSCLNVGNNSFKVNATKSEGVTVKWAVEGTDIDPKWLGIDVFVNLTDNVASLTGGYAVYQVHNPKAVSITIKSANFTFDFVNGTGADITSFKVELLQNVSHSDYMANSTEQCTQCIPTNSTPCGIQNCSKGSPYYYNYTSVEFAPLPTYILFGPLANLTFRISATWPAHLGPQAVDWIPNLDLNGTKYSRKSWQWWNSNWLHYTNITVTEPGIIARDSGNLKNEPIDVPFVPATKPVNCTSEIRVINSTGSEIPSQVWNETYSGGACQSCNVVFLDNFTKSESKTYSVYYNYSSATYPNYALQVSFNDSDGSKNNGTFKINGKDRFLMHNGSIGGIMGDTNSWVAQNFLIYPEGNAISNEMGCQASVPGKWSSNLCNGTYNIIYNGSLKVRLNVTNFTVASKAKAFYYLDVYAGRSVAKYVFPPQWPLTAQSKFYANSLTCGTGGPLWYRNSDGTTGKVAVGTSNFNVNSYGFDWAYVATTDVMVHGWGDQTIDRVLRGYARDCASWEPQFGQMSSNTYNGVGIGNFSNITSFYEEINQNTTTGGLNANNSYMAFTNPVTVSWGSEQTNLPAIGTISANSTITATYANFTATITDETALSGWITGTNASGTAENGTWIAGITGVVAWNGTTLPAIGTVVNVTFYANDSSNNWANRTQLVTVTSASTCTYSGSGDWNVDCAEGCTISADTDIGTNIMVFTGSGDVTVNANLAAGGMDIGDGCYITFVDTKGMDLKYP